MNRFSPNRDRLSRCAAAEMRYFDDIAARTRLLWSVLTLTGVSLLFCAVYYLNENRAPQHLASVWAVGGLFAAYVALCFVRRSTSSRGASSFLTAMVFTVLSLLVTAAVSYLLFRAAWYWEFQGFIPGGAVRLMRGLLPRCLWAPLGVLLLHIGLWFVPVGDAPIRGTRLYLVTVWLPLLPPVGIFLLTFFRDAVAQSKAARVLTVLYLSLCFALAVHYLVKAAAYLILAHSTPAEETPQPKPKKPRKKKSAPKAEAETPAEEVAEAPAEETPAEETPQPKPKKPRKKKTAPKADAEASAEIPAEEVAEAPAAETPAEEAPQPKPKKPRKKKSAPKTEAETPAEDEIKPE